MSATSTQRFLSIFAALVLLVTALVMASPVSADNNGLAEYTVKAGDTLKKIADQYGLTVQKIMDVNKSIKDPNLIYPGQVIWLPTGRSEGIRSTKFDRIFVWQREKNGGRVEHSERLYLVKSGDTIKRIAKAYGITTETLLEANPQVDDANKLFRGELLHIPEGLGEIVPAFYQTPAVPSR